ncbi:MAG: alpha/beta fold hydrolase [Reyranellaceae bacterium]
MDEFMVDLADRRLRAAWLNRDGAARASEKDGFSRPTLVFLHEGLGCIEMWRGFPLSLCESTGFSGLVYDRTAYGRSSPWPADPGIAYMHIEAQQVLPQLLEATGIEDCILIGHSDGGSIALIYAGADPEPLHAVVTMAAHVFAEPISIDSIARAKIAFEQGDLAARLRRYHGENTERAFRLWNAAWLAPDFAGWNIEEFLPGITVPLLAIQGEDDEYGTEAQLGTIAGKAGGYAETRLIADCGHSPHLQAPDETRAAIARFIAPFVG